MFTIYISEVIEHGGQVDVIFMDFSKTFDTVDHGILFRELDTIGICDSLLP